MTADETPQTSARMDLAAGWPKLVIRYPTTPAAVAARLPAGLDAAPGPPIVQIGFYRAIVHNEAEFGVSVRIPAAFNGEAGQYTLGIGIDQESAVYISRECNGQPKYLCDVVYELGDDAVRAAGIHQGTRFAEFDGSVAGDVVVPESEGTETEWWIKSVRGLSTAGQSWDYPPHVVRVRMHAGPTRSVPLTGTLRLNPSAWDPIAMLLPPTGAASAHLEQRQIRSRTIDNVGPLDPEAFWSHADSVGGSHWPGERGAPLASLVDEAERSMPTDIEVVATPGN